MIINDDDYDFMHFFRYRLTSMCRWVELVVHFFEKLLISRTEQWKNT